MKGFFLPLFLDNDEMSTIEMMEWERIWINRRNLFFVLIYIYYAIFLYYAIYIYAIYIMLYFIIESSLIFIFLIFFQNILLLFWIIRWRDNQKHYHYVS